MYGMIDDKNCKCEESKFKGDCDIRFNGLTLVVIKFHEDGIDYKWQGL
jgi:hypothetical protein